MAEYGAIEMLKKDHRKVEEYFESFISAGHKDIETREKAVRNLCFDLTVHMRLEEEIFYPEVEKGPGEGPRLSAQSITEHQKIKDAIIKIKNMRPNDADYDKVFDEIKKNTEHHVKEEEAAVFPFAEQNLADKLGAVLTAKMVSAKAKIKLSEMIGS